MDFVELLEEGYLFGDESTNDALREALRLSAYEGDQCRTVEAFGGYESLGTIVDMPGNIGTKDEYAEQLIRGARSSAGEIEDMDDHDIEEISGLPEVKAELGDASRVEEVGVTHTGSVGGEATCGVEKVLDEE